MTLDIDLTDMYCGAGGTTTGATLAGVNVRYAINHWARAIETHNSNYPDTTHVLTDLNTTDPRRFARTTILAASPECTHHSLAMGQAKKKRQLPLWDGNEEPEVGDEEAERSRCTMWTPLSWAEHHRYEVVILENVVDARGWPPFEAWLQAWTSLEYAYEIVYLNSMFVHPTPQSRDRMYFVAWQRRNRRPDLTITPSAYCFFCEKDIEAVQSWKKPTRRYGKYKQQYLYRCPRCTGEVTPYYHSAANVIDWTLPTPRIGDRQKPLKAKTVQRIQDGLDLFATEPFLVNLNHAKGRPRAVLTHPFSTQTSYDATGVTIPAPFILDHLGEYRPRPLDRAFSTICASGNHHSLVVPEIHNWLMTYSNHGHLSPVQQAAPTVTTVERHALISARPGKSRAENCGFRMLTPKEIQAAMAFPATYIVTGTRREQIKQLGNAVTPPVMKILMERVVASLTEKEVPYGTKS